MRKVEHLPFLETSEWLLLLLFFFFQPALDWQTNFEDVSLISFFEDVSLFFERVKPLEVMRAVVVRPLAQRESFVGMELSSTYTLSGDSELEKWPLATGQIPLQQTELQKESQWTPNASKNLDVH